MSRTGVDAKLLAAAREWLADNRDMIEAGGEGDLAQLVARLARIHEGENVGAQVSPAVNDSLHVSDVAIH